jgi:hypothetical protein
VGIHFIDSKAGAVVDLEGFELSIILIACKLLIPQRGRSVEKVEKA